MDSSATCNRAHPRSLAEREVGAMIDGVIGNKVLPANTRQDIIERTDGIPLFVEEMTKAVLEAGGEGAAERTVAGIPSPAVSVPATLHASLMARIDELGGPAKEVAQIGAAIGREFSHALLAAVARRREAELHSAFDRACGWFAVSARSPATRDLLRTGAGYRPLRHAAARTSTRTAHLHR